MFASKCVFNLSSFMFLTFFSQFCIHKLLSIVQMYRIFPFLCYITEMGENQIYNVSLKLISVWTQLTPACLPSLEVYLSTHTTLMSPCFIYSVLKQGEKINHEDSLKAHTVPSFSYYVNLMTKSQVHYRESSCKVMKLIKIFSTNPHLSH